MGLLMKKVLRIRGCSLSYIYFLLRVRILLCGDGKSTQSTMKKRLAKDTHNCESTSSPVVGLPDLPTMY